MKKEEQIKEKIKIKEIIGVLDKLIILHSSDSDMQKRWNKRKLIKPLVDISEFYNNQLEEIKNERTEKVDKLKKKYNIEEIENVDSSEDDINYPPKYITEIDKLAVSINDRIKKLNNTEVDLPTDLPKLKIKDITKICKTRKVDIYSDDFLKLEMFIEE